MPKAPIFTANLKPLQASNKPNVFWAAKQIYKTDTTQFGLYVTKTFAFKPLAEWSGILFDSSAMLVDETDEKIYFVYNGHLLSLPLPKEK